MNIKYSIKYIKYKRKMLKKNNSLIIFVVIIHLLILISSNNGSFREDDDELQDLSELEQHESSMQNDEIGNLLKEANNFKPVITTTNKLPTTDPMPPTLSDKDLLMNCRTEFECKNLFESIILKHLTKNHLFQKNTKKVNLIWNDK